LEKADPSHHSLEDAGGGGWNVGYAEDIDGEVQFTANRTLTDEQITAYKAAVEFVLERQEQPALNS
jgi:hypothetical protein